MVHLQMTSGRANDPGADQDALSHLRKVDAALFESAPVAFLPSFPRWVFKSKTGCEISCFSDVLAGTRVFQFTADNMSEATRGRTPTCDTCNWYIGTFVTDANSARIKLYQSPRQWKVGCTDMTACNLYEDPSIKFIKLLSDVCKIMCMILFGLLRTCTPSVM